MEVTKTSPRRDAQPCGHLRVILSEPSESLAGSSLVGSTSKAETNIPSKRSNCPARQEHSHVKLAFSVREAGGEEPVTSSAAGAGANACLVASSTRSLEIAISRDSSQ